MFHAFLPSPTRLDFPQVNSGTSYYVELVRALDVSSFKSGALCFRVHDISGIPNAYFLMALIAHPIWPDDGNGARPAFPSATNALPFELDTVTTFDTDSIGVGGAPVLAPADGLFVTRTATHSGLAVEPASLVMPALRVLARITGSGGNLPQGYVVISAGITLVER